MVSDPTPWFLEPSFAVYMLIESPFWGTLFYGFGIYMVGVG